MIWNPNKECMSRDEMHALQSKRLQKLVSYVYHNVAFYRNKMQAMDLSPEDIRSIDDIVKLPLLPNKIYVTIIHTGCKQPLLQKLSVFMRPQVQPEIRQLLAIHVRIWLYGVK